MGRQFEGPEGARAEVTLQGTRATTRLGEGPAVESAATVRTLPGGTVLVEVDGVVRPVLVSLDRDVAWVSRTATPQLRSTTSRWKRVEERRGKHAAHEAHVRSPMTGRVVLLHVQAGDEVAQGQPLVVVEAMKMEHVLKAPRAGQVRRVLCAVGQLVDGGADLVELEAAE